MNNWKDQTLEAARNVYDYAQSWVDPSLKLGVTGLSRSGKTVFITSLIYHLLNRQNLRFFEPHTSGRILKVYLEPHPDDLLPRFDYEGNLAKLTTSPPAWPEGTRHISQLRLTIEYISESWTSRLTGPGKLHIDIIDYPGEWLLDLALLETDYQTWSEHCYQAFESEAGDPLLKNWLNTARKTDPEAEADEGLARQLSNQFKELLLKKRQEAHSLQSISPGRFLMPGDLEGAPALTFAPLIPAKSEAPPGSMAHLMQRRFEAYKTHIARPFYRQFFTRLDRQIVLVDLLTAMSAGPKEVAALSHSLENILGNFNPGAPHWLSSIWNKRIDRLVFAATKADHLHHQAHDQLQTHLARLVKTAIAKAEVEGAVVKVQALAALKSTREVMIEQGGKTFEALIGTPLNGQTFEGRTFNGGEEIHFFPGELPADMEGKKTGWDKSGTLSQLVFTPPDPEKPPLMPHIRLDHALNMLLGDKLV